MLPNFYIVGTPKSGTTSLSSYLNAHPEVFMCHVKEPNYFSHDELERQNLYYAEKGVARQEDYEKLFAGVTTEKAIGEASVSYLFYKNVPPRIKAVVPDAKIIVILRNPVDRGFSHYLMDFRLGYVELPFEDIVYKRVAHPLLHLYYQQFVELGFYFDQVKRYLDIFGAGQVKIYLNEDLRDDISQVVRSLYCFLDVDPGLLLDLEKQYNVYREPKNALVKRLYPVKSIRRLARTMVPPGLFDKVKDTLLVRGEKPDLSPGTRTYLNELFKNNIMQTSDLIGRDLSHWCGE